MIYRSLTKGVRTIRVSNAVVAGTTDIECTAVDMLKGPYEAVRFTVLLGALTATQVTQVKAQGSNDDSTYVDIAGTLVGPVADTDGNKVMILELYRPAHRYIKAIVDRGTANAVVDGVLAELFLSQREPLAKDTTVAAQVVVPYAVAGTP